MPALRPGSAIPEPGVLLSVEFSEPERERIVAKTLKVGDKVKWNTSQGETHGVVEKKQTSDTKIKTHQVKASKDDPQYIVKSDRTGAEAAHKPEALHKR